MSKKHWIYIKRGLSEDAKHRAQMGECIWLYMHIIDRADWETGIAYDWKDREEAADMCMAFETLRDQRQKLEKMDYIRCIQKQRGQDIKIMEWRNPREYGSEVKNPRIQGDATPPPSAFQGNPQGDVHGDPQGSSQTVTPTLDSKSESSPMDSFLAFEKMKEGHEKQSWQFRESFRESHLPFADWWHEVSGQPINKAQMKSCQKAFNEWDNQRIGLKSLKEAFEARSKWKKVIADPNEITKDAAAIQALPEPIKPEPTRPEYRPLPPDPNENKYVPNPLKKPAILSK